MPSQFIRKGMSNHLRIKNVLWVSELAQHRNHSMLKANDITLILGIQKLWKESSNPNKMSSDLYLSGMAWQPTPTPTHIHTYTYSKIKN